MAHNLVVERKDFIGSKSVSRFKDFIDLKSISRF
jgi:hypothetical protein